MRDFLCSIETSLKLFLFLCRHWHSDSLGEFPDPEARGPVLQPVVRVRPHALLRLLAIRPCRRHPLVRWLESRTHQRWGSPRLKLFYSGIWIQWGSEIRPFEIRKHLESRLFEGWISNGPVFKCLGFTYCVNHLKTGLFIIWTFLPEFQMVSDKMVAIFPDYKWLGFRISDPIESSDHLQPNLFWTIQNSDKVKLQIPTVVNIFFFFFF